MRIGLLTYALDRPLSGISRYTIDLVRALASLPDAPELILFTAGGPGPLAGLDLPTVSLPGCHLLPGMMSLGSAYAPLLIKRFKLDIIHDSTGMFPFFLGAAHAKKVTTLYDVIPWSFPGVSTRWDTLVYRHLLPRTLPHVDAILTISEASRADIARYLPVSSTRIHNVYAGVSDAYTPDGSNGSSLNPHAGVTGRVTGPYVLFLGSGEERKNLSRVLRAYARIRQAVPHKLVIAGTEHTAISQQLAALDLQEHVVFTGYVDDADLPALYRGADLFVFPSLYEGFGLPVLEAMACGTPVVTSNRSSLPEVAGNAALLVDPCDVDAIAAAMRRALEDAGLRLRLREAGLARARHFTWERTARETLRVYEQVCHS